MCLSLSHWYPGPDGVVLDCVDSDLCTLTFFNILRKPNVMVGQTDAHTDNVKAACTPQTRPDNQRFGAYYRDIIL